MTETIQISWRTMPTPVGPLTIVWGRQGLIQADFTDSFASAKKLVAQHKLGELEALQTEGGVIEQSLQRYFSGKLDVLDEIPIAPVGTDFSRQVWQELCRTRRFNKNLWGDCQKTGAVRSCTRSRHGLS